MLPYLQPPVLHIGPIAVSAFALLLGVAVLTSIELAARRARVMQLAPSDVAAFTTWVVVPALVVAHLVHALWHRHAVVERDPSYLVDMTSGLSFVGGLLGVALGLGLWRRLDPSPILPYADTLTSVTPIAWMVARAGCTLAHHHPGVRTSANNPLAFAYPDGARWDLGLLELLLATGCTLVFLVLWRRPRAPGTYVALGALLYAPSRFAFDFLRASPLHGGDPRYAGLTAAQWGCFLLAGIGFLAWRNVHEERGRARRAPVASAGSLGHPR